jgi:hypothetical protein
VSRCLMGPGLFSAAATLAHLLCSPSCLRFEVFFFRCGHILIYPSFSAHAAASVPVLVCNVNGLYCSRGAPDSVSDVARLMDASFLSNSVVLIETNIAASAHTTLCAGHVLFAAPAGMTV